MFQKTCCCHFINLLSVMRNDIDSRTLLNAVQTNTIIQPQAEDDCFGKPKLGVYFFIHFRQKGQTICKVFKIFVNI